MTDQDTKKAVEERVIGEEQYTTAEKKELLEFYTSCISASVQPRKIVEARVIEVGKKYVVLDLGEKSDGFLPKTDFKEVESIKVGDTTEVYIEHLEDFRGHLVVSRKKALHLKAWKTLEEAKEDGTTLEGFVKRKIKGGLVLDVLGIEVFLPGGQVDVVRTSSEELEGYIGHTVDVRVIKISPKKQNVVVSRRKPLEDKQKKENQKLLSSLQLGDVVPTTITSIATFGLFLKIDGKVVGLLHKKDIASRKRIQNVTEAVDDKGVPLFKVGQQMEAAIKHVDLEKNHISLSTKLLSWSKLPEDIVVGSKIKIVITEMTDSYAIAEVIGGVIAFLHVTEMFYSIPNMDPQDFIKLGETLEVMVLEIDREQHELHVSLKKLMQEHLLKAIEEKRYEVGKIYPCTVHRVFKHGVILTLEPGIYGYVDKKNLSWLEKVQDPTTSPKSGDVVDAMVLEITKEEPQVLLGLREAVESPWPALRETFMLGSVHEATILKLVSGGAIVQLPKGVQNFLPSKELQSAKEGDVLSLKVIRFIEEEQKIMLSSNIDQEPIESNFAGKSTKKSYSYQESQTHLGDLEVLKQLKKELSEKDKEEKPVKKKAKKK
ncbi:MAG: S1 RNA-binding domain-containing protein [Cytophagales bacterium]